MSMEIEAIKRQGVVVLSLEGRLDSNTAPSLEERLKGLMGTGETLFVLDFDKLDYISSAGLRVLINAAKELKCDNGQLCLCSIRDYIREVFDICGLTRFFPMHPTVEDSLKFCR
jgi:anti-sigma B factor antagonist